MVPSVRHGVRKECRNASHRSRRHPPRPGSPPPRASSTVALRFDGNHHRRRVARRRRRSARARCARPRRDLRHHALQPDRTRGARGGAAASAARARRRARRRRRRRWPRARCSTRPAAGELAYFDAGGADAGLSEGAGTDASRTAARRRGRRRDLGSAAGAPSGARGDLGRLLDPGRGASSIARRIDDRAALFRAAADAWRSGRVRMGRSARSCCST